MVAISPLSARQMTGNGAEVLSRRTTDDWHNTHPSGCEVAWKFLFTQKLEICPSRIQARHDQGGHCVRHNKTERFILPEIQPLGKGAG